uniref:CCHC-type domain-containing protein n=1 Tax=Oncorhynchus mykiss TaxID=8022 RepID=A0A8C7NHZ5_ONCMY
MAQNSSNRLVPGIGLANTVRFAWKDKEIEPFGRETFGRTILMWILKLTGKDVFCLQGYPLEGTYDVALHSEEKHDEILKKVREVGGARPMCHYEVTSLAKNNFRIVTVNIYNPYVKDKEVRAFLGRYMDGISSARHLKDSLGFWNGRRDFQALLREDPKGLGGYLHPPAMFSLGADKGTLFYARQPPFCRSCMAYGHILASCSTRKCRFCGSGEHDAKDCDELKACHGCGSSAHLWQECPASQRSYVSAVGGGAGAGDGGRGGGPDQEPSTGPEGMASRKEEEQRAAAGGEGDREGTGAAKPGGEEGKEAEGSKGVEEPERASMAGEVVEKESGAGPVEGVGGQQNAECPRGSDGGMVEELEGGGGGVFLLPPSQKKRGKRKGLSTDSEREGGMEGVAKRVIGVGETSVSSLASPAPQLLEELDTPSTAQGWSTGGGLQFLFGDMGSPTLYPTIYGAGEVEEFGGQSRMQGTQEPNTIPASWVGAMEEDWGTSGGETEQESIE